ncbi:MAG: hypothetical protein BWY09_01308 [Candidatus Hydrogenedentes bacterium ADurb.Bin179]|nr:MAG: hypothetical protein BWY09_01308 [Candidatus Hydrogenedentes bacterium ADurb.Bin179]
MSAYFSYPYRDEDGRNDAAHLQADRVARGGSWRDRPYRAAATFRLPYRPYQRVFNVGFRVAVKMTASLTSPVRTALDAANLNK